MDPGSGLMRSGCGFISASSPADGIDGTAASGPLAQPRHVHATVRAGPAPGPSAGPPRSHGRPGLRWPSGTTRGAAVWQRYVVAKGIGGDDDASSAVRAARRLGCPRPAGVRPEFSAGQGLVQVGADRVLQLAKRVHIGAAAAPLPVQPVDSLRAATEEVPGCRVVDVGIDQLRPAATLPDAVPAPVLLDELPAPGPGAAHDDMSRADPDDGAGGVAGPAELGTGLDGHRVAGSQCRDLVGGEPVDDAHDMCLFPCVVALGDDCDYARRSIGEEAVAIPGIYPRSAASEPAVFLPHGGRGRVPDRSVPVNRSA